MNQIKNTTKKIGDYRLEYNYSLDLESEIIDQYTTKVSKLDILVLLC